MNLKRKDLKIIMVIIGIFIIYLLAVTFVFKRNPLDVISPNYIVNSDGLFWNYSNGKISDMGTSFNKTDGNYRIFLNNGDEVEGDVYNRAGTISVARSGSSELMDSGYILATNIGRLDFVKYKVNNVSPSGNVIIRTYLDDFSGSSLAEFDVEEVRIDLDGDNEEDVLYFLSNLKNRDNGIKKSSLLVGDGSKINRVVAESAIERYDLYAKTYIAIVASGTVSAELAMLHIPTIVIYKMNPVTTWLVRQVIRVNWVSLVNILLNRGVYPEFLGPDANTENVLDAVQQLTIPSVRQKMIDMLKSADKLWRRPDGAPATLIADSVRRAVKKKK